MSQIIDLNNYESFVLDYLEGNLHGDLLRNFLSFLNQNPSIKCDIESIFPQVSKDSECVFPSVLSIAIHPFDEKIEVNSENYQDIFIAYHEGDLTENQKEDVRQFLISNPNFLVEFEVFRKLKISANKQIIIPDFSGVLIDEELGISVNDAKLIDLVENDLSNIQNSGDRSDLSPQQNLILGLYSKTKLIPDQTIIFKSKSSLFRDEYPILWKLNTHRIANVVSTIAAVFLIGLYNPAVFSPQNIDNQIKTFDKTSKSSNSFAVIPQTKPDSRPIRKFNKKHTSELSKELETVHIRNFEGFNQDPIQSIGFQNVNKSSIGLRFPEMGIISNSEEEIITPMPVLAYLKDKVKSYFKGEEQKTELYVDWQQVATLGFARLSEFTNSEAIQKFTDASNDQSKIFSLKSRSHNNSISSFHSDEEDY